MICDISRHDLQRTKTPTPQKLPLVKRHSCIWYWVPVIKNSVKKFILYQLTLVNHFGKGNILRYDLTDTAGVLENKVLSMVHGPAQWISVLVVQISQIYLDSMFYHIMNAKLYFCVFWEIVVSSSDKPICPGPCWVTHSNRLKYFFWKLDFSLPFLTFVILP